MRGGCGQDILKHKLSRVRNKHKLSTLVSAKKIHARNASAVGRVPLGRVRTGPGRPQHSFSPSTLRRLTGDVDRVNVVRPVALERVDSRHFRVVTNRHH